MYATPTLSANFRVTTIGNSWTEEMSQMFMSLVMSIEMDYVHKEILLKIRNTVSIVAQNCIADLIDNGVKTLTLEILAPDGTSNLQFVKFREIKVIHHSLRYCYSEQGLAYHLLVLSYEMKDISNGSK